MFNEELKQILVKKEITTKDKIIFRVILDILNAIFTDEHHVSILKVGYKIDEHQQIWFPNIVLDRKKELAIKNGYAIYLSEDWNYIYQYMVKSRILCKFIFTEQYFSYQINLV
ncbi:hypothetical protein [Spiroplasma sp. AdecLV25b]|uniref:hypothetical protein n=1 Tax=Spiroplasma sp. AdecLV25b TaxID=3027162 RepID=UPI0027E1A6FB|nr:hypothetical protein [Spiroplasma sp. AdecLV25b]